LNRSDVPPEKHDELIGMVQRESTRLSNMTQDFLDFARLESGRVRLAREPVDMAALVDEVVRIAQSQAASRHIVIDTDLPPGLPTADSTPVVCGDSDRLKQVLLNLVSNAVKYNVENGRVTVRAKVEETEIELSVADTGPGIAPQDLEHLFDRFYRIPKDEKVVEGSGMGLTIAKKIVEEHDGRIEVGSVVGEGTTFTVFLPLTMM
jgi:signal transduction histidine kinase